MTFPAGDVHGTGTVLAAVPLPDGRIAVVTDSTPFHPLDPWWPDQPGDTGWIDAQRVLDTVVAAPDGAGRLQLANVLLADGVRRDDPAATWVVAHLLEGPAPAPRSRVELNVDVERRAALSAGHTACHLAALALNEATAALWRKPAPRLDSRGNPDLDQLAMQQSRIQPHGSRDEYRFGRTLRKSGFEVAGFREQHGELRARAQELLDTWCATGGAVRVETAGDRTLAARRSWACDLPDGTARIPCGGTHLRTLADLGGVRIGWTLTEGGLVVDTRAGAATGEDGGRQDG